jgi:hypothetical protein
MKSPKPKWSLRYYLYLERPYPLLLRLPNVMHRKILREEFAIPKLANTNVRLLEVFVSTTRKGKILDARPTAYKFGPDGRVDLRSSVEAVSLAIERATSHRPSSNVVDLGPSIRSKRWKNERTWIPSENILAQVQSDLNGSGRRRVRTVIEFLKSS